MNAIGMRCPRPETCMGCPKHFAACWWTFVPDGRGRRLCVECFQRETGMTPTGAPNG